MSLETIIKNKITSEKIISFREFMQMALYYPQYGYYASSKEKVSDIGDFITATSQTSIFATVFAQQFGVILTELGSDGYVIEFGAGTGKFACDCMRELERINSLPKKYLVIELSNDLKQRQQEHVKKELPHLYDRFEWLLELPKSKLKAVVFANEVLDAMAVDIFKARDNELVQQGVELDKGDNFVLKNMPENDVRFQLEADKILSDGVSFGSGYVSEFNTWIRPWAKSISDVLEQGVVFLCDYGYHRNLYYMPERKMGTLACYYQHKVNYDPFINVGSQDITAHVDFTAVAESFDKNGFALDGYMTQANFLKRANIADIFPELLQRTPVEKRSKYINDLKELLLGDKLAEVFKVFCCSINYDKQIDVFDNDDNIEAVL